MPKLLYIEDDQTLAFLTKEQLENNGFEVLHAMTGAEAKKLWQDERPFDLIILDVMLPDTDGFEFVTFFREVNQDIPILFLTARVQKQDRIKGLQLGADDYITKPYSIEELLLRISIFLRRSKVHSTENTIEQAWISFGDSRINSKDLRIDVAGVKKSITQRECDVLMKLITQLNELVRREEILKDIWGKNDYFMGRSLDVFISRLRKILQDDISLHIENVHGVGFRLSERNMEN